MVLNPLVESARNLVDDVVYTCKIRLRKGLYEHERRIPIGGQRKGADTTYQNSEGEELITLVHTDEAAKRRLIQTGSH